MPTISVLRYYRKKNKMTVSALSKELCIPCMTIKSWEKLHRSIEFIDAESLAIFFDESIKSFLGKKSMDISNSEYHELYRPNSIYIPHEIKVHDKYKKLIDRFLYTKRPKSNMIIK